LNNEINNNTAGKLKQKKQVNLKIQLILVYFLIIIPQQFVSTKSIQFDEQPNQQRQSIKKNEILTIIGTLFMMIFQLSISLSLVLTVHGLQF
jgi:hypothetical protein